MKNNIKKLLLYLALPMLSVFIGAWGGGSKLSTSESTSTSTSTANNSPEVTYSTGNILCDLNELSFNSDESVNANSSYNWSCNTDNRLLTGNGIPNHEVGTFPNTNNPNTIGIQTINKTFTTNPSTISSSGAAVVALEL